MADQSPTDERDLAPNALPGDRIWECLAAFPEIRELAVQIYSPEAVERFMTTPQPRFDGRAPFDLMATGRSDLVFAALAADHDRFPY